VSDFGSGNIQPDYNSENSSRENMSGNVSEFESGQEQLNEGNGGFDGGKRKSRRKHRARKR